MRRTRPLVAIFAALFLIVAAVPAVAKERASAFGGDIYYTVVWKNPATALANLKTAKIKTASRHNYLKSVLPRTTIKVKNQAELLALHNIIKSGNVKAVFRNELLRSSAFPSDGAPNDPKYATRQWDLPMIEMSAAWAKTTGIAGVKVAVGDTGLDTAHEDFVGMDVANGTSFNWGYYDFGVPYYDDYGMHGTHVTGTIAAQSNNGIGIAGMVPDVTIMPIAVLGPDGSGTWDDVFAGIEYAAANGARVINLSLGGGGAYSEAAPYQAIVDAAYAAGTLVVAASGNEALFDYNYPTYPVALDKILGVGGVNRDGGLGWFSNGTFADVVAPGDRTFSTVPDDMYATYSGTSMATPHVTAIAAALFSRDESLTPGQVSALIRASATQGDLRYDQVGQGLVSAGDALDLLDSVKAGTTKAVLAFEDEHPMAFEMTGSFTMKGSMYDPLDKVADTTDCRVIFTFDHDSDLGTPDRTFYKWMPDCGTYTIKVSGVAAGLGVTVQSIIDGSRIDSYGDNTGSTRVYAQLQVAPTSGPAIRSGKTELVLLASDTGSGGGGGGEGEVPEFAWTDTSVAPIFADGETFTRTVVFTAGDPNDWDTWCYVVAYEDGEWSSNYSANINSSNGEYADDGTSTWTIGMSIPGIKPGEDTEIKMVCDYFGSEESVTVESDPIWIARAADATGAWSKGNRVMYAKGAVGGSYLRSTVVGGLYEASISASEFGLLAQRRTANPSKVKVYIDGVLDTTVTFTGSTSWRVPFYTKDFGTSGSHSFKLENVLKYGDIDAIYWR